MVLSVMAMFSAMVEAQPLEVVAVDYPYFTEKNSSPKHGVAFDLLRQAIAGSDFEIQPLFLPPARAHQTIKSSDWCASFYPAAEQTATKVLMSLSDEAVLLGLYRRRQGSTFAWQQLSELKGKRVAYLRALSRDGVGKLLADAGLEMFNVETINQGMMLLVKGRVDFAFGDKYSGELFFGENGIDANEYQFSTSYLRELTVGVWLNLDCLAAQELHEILHQRGYKVVPD